MRAKEPRSEPKWLSVLAWGVAILCLFAFVGKYLFDRYQRSALFEASARGDNARLRVLLRLGVNPNLVEHADDPQYELTPIVLAAKNGKWSTVHLLLDAGAKADTQDSNGFALYYAVHTKNMAAIRELLEHNANPNIRALSSPTVLGPAVQGGEAPIVAELLDAKADPNSWCDIDLDALCHRLDLVILVVAHGANVNLRSQVTGPPKFREGGYTPLMASVSSGSKEVTQFLLAHGASPNVRWTPMDPARGDFITPLRVAVKAKRPDIVDLLRRAGAKE